MALVDIVVVGRWIAAGLLGSLSLLLIIANPLTAIHVTRQGRNYSWVPLIGGVAGLLAVLAAPIGTLGGRLWFAWIPLVLDVTIPMLIWVLVWHVLLGRSMGGSSSSDSE